MSTSYDLLKFAFNSYLREKLISSETNQELKVDIQKYFTDIKKSINDDEINIVIGIVISNLWMNNLFNGEDNILNSLGNKNDVKPKNKNGVLIPSNKLI